MSREIGKRDCVPRTDAVVLEIGSADLRFPAARIGQKDLKGFAFLKFMALNAPKRTKRLRLSKGLRAVRAGQPPKGFAFR